MTGLREAFGMRLEVGTVADAETFERVMALRYEVFCDEQGVPREIERDDEDRIALHLWIAQDGRALATGRVYRYRADGSGAALDGPARPGDLARIGRMAVARSERGSGLGAKVLAALEAQAARAGLAEAVLHAQLHAEPFYARAGYQRHGPEFEEAGIGHVEMRKRLA